MKNVCELFLNQVKLFCLTTKNYRTPGGTLDVSARQTRDLWKRTFNEEFFMPGAMYRGAKPSARDYSANFHINYDFIEKWLFSYELLSANLAGKNARETDASFQICVLGNLILFTPTGLDFCVKTSNRYETSKNWLIHANSPFSLDVNSP